MKKRRILVIDDNANLRAALAKAFEARGYQVITNTTARPANNRSGKFNLIIKEQATNGAGGRVRNFQFDASNFAARDADRDELRFVVEQTLEQLRLEDGEASVERIEFELPSDVALMHRVLDFIVARVAAHGLIEPDDTHLFIALDEAFVNAVKHGNKHDVTKIIRLDVEINEREARFTIEDEGEGFDLRQVPDPRAPENIFKTSGRGVLLIQNIMDEVQYNARGNRLVMIKRKSQIPSPKSQVENSKSKAREPRLSSPSRDEESHAN